MKWKIRFTAQYLFSMRIQRFLMKTYLSCTNALNIYHFHIIIGIWLFVWFSAKAGRWLRLIWLFIYIGNALCLVFETLWNCLSSISLCLYTFIYMCNAVYLHKSNWCIFIFVKMLTCIYKQRLHFYLLHRCTFQTEVMWNKINFNSFPF